MIAYSNFSNLATIQWYPLIITILIIFYIEVMAHGPIETYLPVKKMTGFISGRLFFQIFQDLASYETIVKNLLTF